MTLRGGNGVGRLDLHIGAQALTGGPNATATGAVDLTSTASTGGGSIDALVDELLLGRSGNGLTFGGIGTLTFHSGIINANTVILGRQAPEAGGRTRPHAARGLSR